MSQSNGVAVDDKERGQSARNELELYERVSKPSTDDDFLDQNNLGLGNYSSRERWQQVQSFREHMFSEASVVPMISDSALYQTRWQLGEQVLEKSSQDDPVELAKEKGLIDDDERLVGRRHAIIRLGENKFEKIGTDTLNDSEFKNVSPSDRKEVEAKKKIETIQDEVGDPGFLTPHSRMISARHETSRSVNAHLIDNLFSRVHEQYKREDSSQPNSASNGDGLGGFDL